MCYFYLKTRNNTRQLTIMVPDDIYQPIYSSLKFMAVALGVTIAFGVFVFSRFAQIRLRRVSPKRLFGSDEH